MVAVVVVVVAAVAGAIRVAMLVHLAAASIVGGIASVATGPLWGLTHPREVP